MRALPILLAVFPVAAIPFASWAEDIPLSTDVSAVTLYPQGGTVTREVAFDAPAGKHDLILLDLPRNTDLETVRVEVEGAALGSVNARRDYVPPRDDSSSAEIVAAEAEVERLETALRGAQDGIRAIRLEAEAAQARVAFLSQIGEGEGIAQMDVSALRDLVGMIGEETLAAKQAAHEAGQRAAAAERDLKDLVDALQKAREALAALVPQETPRAMLALSVEAEAATRGKVTLTYNIFQGGWAPVYDMKLDRASGRMVIERGAFIAQATGENWEDVALTLSTVRPVEQTEPSDIWAQRRWIEDEEELKRKGTYGSLADAELSPRAVQEYAEADAPVLAEPVVAGSDYDGLAVTYTYPEPVDMASGADQVRIALGTLDTGTDVFARAVPLSDRTAFLMAGMTNDTGDMILPGTVMKYLDGRFVGRGYTDLIPVGAEADVSFGPIEGLRLTRVIKDREEGDRGMISRSNDITEKVRIEVENLTGETWPVQLWDRVPYSEQEDLEISWKASPAPDTRDLDDKRGVLEWRFDLDAGATKVVTIDQYLEWPEGQVLR